MSKINIFWFRRDLRLHDNAGLYHALKGYNSVQAIFIFDKNILDKLPAKDARVNFIHDALKDLKKELNDIGADLKVYYGYPTRVWSQILEQQQVETIYTNRDYEPYALKRDTKVKMEANAMGIQFKDYKDHVIFDYNEVVKKDGNPYTVFTPYSKVWKAKLDTKLSIDTDGNTISYYLKSYPNQKYFNNFEKSEKTRMPTLGEMGFEESDIKIPSAAIARKVIKNYDKTRNFPALEDGTSRLGIHFRHGTISIREKAHRARALNETYLNELIWRDFYSQILFHFPHVKDAPFRAKYEAVEWRYDGEEFRKWCEGKTGYPIVDAGMRELNTTGYMHNRVRMITASFLTKHLLMDWRLGEAYFAEKLIDFDLASNNGGWQWAAGCGTDAAPYFRVFNPYTQQEKFDENFEYIKKWVPEYGTENYPEALVEHKFARQRALDTYKKGLDGV